MDRKKKLSIFILKGDFSEEMLNRMQHELFWNDRQLIKETFLLMKYELGIYKNEPVFTKILSNSIELLSILCDRNEFTSEEVVINRKRIKKTREKMLYYATENNNTSLYRAANKFDEIVLEKSIKTNDLIKLIKIVIERKDDINIIKRLLSTNKNAIKNRNELFDYTFHLALEALKENSAYVYYYISLLKVFYSSSIDFKHYNDLLNESNVGYDIFVEEIHNIVSGIKRSLNRSDILNKYGIVTNLACPNIIIPSEVDGVESAITLDESGSAIRDDALRVRKIDNDYLVSTYIADPTYTVEFNSPVDKDARNNFKCLFLPNTSVRLFNSKLERSLSLDEGTYRNVIALNARIRSNGKLLDYNFDKRVIKIKENLRFEDGDKIIDSGKDKLADQLRDLYDLALILETINPQKINYWHQKETDSISKQPVKHMSDKIVSELMTLYNTLIAELASKEGIPYVYRIHENLYIKKLIKELGIETSESAQRLINSLYLPSKFSTVPKYHHGLNIPIYSHSSSPIISYPDLYNEYLFHAFYFKDSEMNFDPRMHEKLVDYFNQRSAEMTLLKGDYIRAKK